MLDAITYGQDCIVQDCIVQNYFSMGDAHGTYRIWNVYRANMIIVPIGRKNVSYLIWLCKSALKEFSFSYTFFKLLMVQCLIISRL